MQVFLLKEKLAGGPLLRVCAQLLPMQDIRPAAAAAAWSGDDFHIRNPWSQEFGFTLDCRSLSPKGVRKLISLRTGRTILRLKHQVGLLACC